MRRGHRPPEGGAAYERVVAALLKSGSRYGGGQDWTCPAHDDSNPSLGVKEASNGYVLVNCQRGCQTPDVMAALGMTTGDLFPDDDHPALYRKVATYDYKDEQGTPLYQVVRRECRQFPGERCPAHGKRITQQAWRDGRWVTGEGAMTGVRRVLYRLPEVLAAVATGEPVYIVEGEKDADLLNDGEDVYATTAPEGAGKWRDEYAEALRGATVIVIPDHDPAGYKHARTVYESCARTGANVSLALPKPRHRGADYSDHATAGGGVESLEPIQLDDLMWTETEPGSTPRAAFTRVTARELAKDPEPLRWLAKGLLTEATYGPVAGERKSLKSWTSTAIAVAVAAGLPVFGEFAVPRARPVVCYVGEGGRHMFQRRLRGVAEAYGVAVADLPLVAYFDVAPLASAAFQESLAADLDDLSPGLVIVDPLYAFHGTDTNSSDLYARGALLTAASAPVVAAGATLLINDHFNKTGTGTDLGRISQAGMGEWADSWLLLSHRADPDVAAGDFQLQLEVGSRQWGGRTFDLDMSVGEYDHDTGEHVGSFGYTVARSDPNAAKVLKASAAQNRAERDLLDVLRDEPFQHTKTSAITTVGGKAETARAAWDSLRSQRKVVSRAETVENERGHRNRREVWDVAEGADTRVRMGSGGLAPSQDRDGASPAGTERPR